MDGQAIERVKEWLLARKPELEDLDLDLDLDLIENRVIDSLSFMDFLFFLEELTERDLQAEAGSANTFRTLRTIQERILAAGA